MTAESWLRQMREHVRASAVVIPADVNVIELGARTLLWAVLIFLGWSYVASPLMRSQLSPSFVHFLLARIDLVFHEAGHILFLPFGRFLSVLGGSLLQILIPLVCTYTFLLRHQNAFGASVTLWWTGQSFIELAPYVADASSQGEPYITVVGKKAPQARVIFDRFHIVKHLNEAVDKTRRELVRELKGTARRNLKNTKFPLLKAKHNRSAKDKRVLREQVRANRRLYRAMLLRDDFMDLYTYKTETWAKKFLRGWLRRAMSSRIEPVKRAAKMTAATSMASSRGSRGDSATADSKE